MLSRLISHLLIGFYISNHFFLLNFDHCDMYMVCTIFFRNDWGNFNILEVLESSGETSVQLATRESRSLSSQIIKTLLVVLKPLNAIYKNSY